MTITYHLHEREKLRIGDNEMKDNKMETINGKLIKR